ncbi:uncharacterized protein [Mytilus edulis]|uniref:uncharacterized protein n=1 Tax=Mytilus edulis TaxID=6550 RepID=UPI0039EF9716
MKHVLEKTQTEVYISFKEKYPDLKISQRLFERLKPYFVVPVRPCDRETCCCRYHVEARYLFKSCMDFRKKITPFSEHFPIFTHLTDLTNHALCPKTDGQEYHQLKCVERRCDDCGVNKLHLLEDELSLTTESPNVEWMRYEYVFVPTKSGEKKKLCLVKVNTKPGEMFKYFLELISKFSAHVFRAKWQTEQLKSIKSNLKKNEAICIHDFSENYSCKDKIEIQACYFQKTEVSIHVSVIYRHPIENLDGSSDPEVNGGLVEEQFFVISPDQVHDHNFSHEAQRQIADYLKSINYDLKTMHEFTDGCATQYKSRHCFGDLSYAKQDFGFNIVRNYFETSHAKGVQDAAGGLIKNQADFAVARGKLFIQNANDFYNFCKDNLETPRQSAICKRRIFRYVEEVPRNRTRSFKVVPSVRCIHQIRSTSPRNVLVRDLSCYDCSNCPDEYNACTSEAGIFRKYKLCHETELTERLIANSDENTFIELIQPGFILAVFTDDPGEDYYILKCLSDVKKLNQSTFDDWGNTFQAGVQLIEGLYFDKLCVNGNNIQFKLIK